MIEVIILAGGLGTRLRAVVPDVPKPMAPVAGKPFLALLLRGLALQGVKRVIISMGYKAEAISNYFGTQFDGMELVYSMEDIPLGTGGALRSAFSLCHKDHVLVMNGDTYLDLNICMLENTWQRKRRPLIVAQEVMDTARYGRLEIKDGRVVDFGEKAVMGPGLINVGCYLFPTNLLDNFPVGQTFSLETDFLATAVRLTPFEVFNTHGRFIDIGVPEDYARAQVVLANQ